MTSQGLTPEGPEVTCPWCDAPIPLAHFARSDEETGTDVAVCRSCGRRVPLALPLQN